MENTTYFIVGDKYEFFAEFHDNVLTMSRANELLNKTQFNDHLSFIFGLGNCAIKKRHFTAQATKTGARVIEPSNAPAPIEIARADKPENVLISMPERIGPQAYSANFIIDEKNTEMEQFTSEGIAAKLRQGIFDSNAEQHVRGRLIFDATLQLCIAVGLIDILPSQHIQSEKLLFIVNNFHFDFKNFIFPLCAQIQLKITEITNKWTEHNLTVGAEITFFQGSTERAKILVKYTIFAADYIMRVEKTFAARTLKQMARAAHPHAHQTF